MDLRGFGHFVRNPPNMEHQNAWKQIHGIMGELEDYLYKVRLVDPNKYAGASVGTSRKRGKQHNSKGCKKKGHGNPPSHRPVPASGHHNVGSRNFTHRQVGAAKNIHKSYANTVSEEHRSQHPDWSSFPAFELAPSCFRMAL